MKPLFKIKQPCLKLNRPFSGKDCLNRRLFIIKQGSVYYYTDPCILLNRRLFTVKTGSNSVRIERCCRGSPPGARLQRHGSLARILPRAWILDVRSEWIQIPQVGRPVALGASQSVGCFYGCFLVIEAHGGTWFRTPCPNCRAKPSSRLFPVYIDSRE